jgi:hypothetical protein
MAAVVLSAPYFSIICLPRTVNRVQAMTAMRIRRLPNAYPEEKSIPRSKITIEIPTKAITIPNVFLGFIFSLRVKRDNTRTKTGVAAYRSAPFAAVEYFMP